MACSEIPLLVITAYVIGCFVHKLVPRDTRANDLELKAFEQQLFLSNIFLDEKLCLLLFYTYKQMHFLLLSRGPGERDPGNEVGIRFEETRDQIIGLS